MDQHTLTFTVGVQEANRLRAAELIDQAFATKLRFAIPDDIERLEVLAGGLNLDAAIGASLGDQLVGIAGIKTRSYAVFDGITFRLLREELGLGAIRAALVLHLLDSPATRGTIRIELIAVDASMRGKGVGSGLLGAIDHLGCVIGAAHVELDVVDSNPDAHRLYLRQGFVETRTETLPIPASWMGFQESITMVKPLTCR